MKILGPATNQEVHDAIFNTNVGTTYERADDDQHEYTCKRCGRVFFAGPKAWIFASLCDPCFSIQQHEKWQTPPTA